MHACMCGWMHGWIDACMHVWLDAWMDRCMHVLLCMWVHVCMASVYVCMCARVPMLLKNAYFYEIKCLLAIRRRILYVFYVFELSFFTVKYQK
jgi:hypothetical protein